MDHFVSLTKETIVELISYAKYQVVYTASRQWMRMLQMRSFNLQKEPVAGAKLL